MLFLVTINFICSIIFENYFIKTNKSYNNISSNNIYNRFQYIIYWGINIIGLLSFSFYSGYGLGSMPYDFYNMIYGKDNNTLEEVIKKINNIKKK